MMILSNRCKVSGSYWGDKKVPNTCRMPQNLAMDTIHLVDGRDPAPVNATIYGVLCISGGASMLLEPYHVP